MLKFVEIFRRVIKLSIYLLLLSGSAMVSAQQIAPLLQNEVDFKFPGIINREALVELEMTISSDGKVSEIQEVGGFHSSRFVEVAIDAAQQLIFTPATEAGNDIDWPGLRIDFRFIRKGQFHTVRPSASILYREIETLMMDNDLVNAERIITNVLEDDIELYYEYSLFHLKLAEIYIASDRLLEASHAIRIATASYQVDEHNNFNSEIARVRDTYVVNNILGTTDSNFSSTSIQVQQSSSSPQPVIQAIHKRGSLRATSARGFGASMEKGDLNVLNYGLLKSAYLSAFYIHTALGDIKEQYDDYTKLQNLAEADINVAMTSQIDTSNALLASGQNLYSRHSILDFDEVFFPSHSIFAAINVEGQIDSVDFQCESRTIRLKFEEEVEWAIPQSWGECGLRFRGESGATFSVVEFAE